MQEIMQPSCYRRLHVLVTVTSAGKVVINHSHDQPPNILQLHGAGLIIGVDKVGNMFHVKDRIFDPSKERLDGATVWELVRWHVYMCKSTTT